MTPQQMDAVRRSFEKVTAFNALAGTQFCEHLFAIDPSLRRRFGGDVSEQGQRLMRSVSSAVRHLSNPGVAAASLKPRHPAPIAHFDAVAEAMMWTLKDNLGPEFTPEVRSAWLALCDLVADAMRRN